MYIRAAYRIISSRKSFAKPLTMRIEEAIKQAEFPSAHHRANINILYTASWLNQQTNRLLKPFDISMQQFNILRILRGLKGKPATIKLLTQRMLDKMSNASRLVDKLDSKGLVQRKTCKEDRRRVDIFITQKGMDLLREASASMEDDLAAVFATLSSAEADQLSNLLDKLRGSEQ